MDFLRRIEDDVRNLGVEAKRKHPEVREAAEKGLVMLKAMRESYVAEVMRASGTTAPKIAKFRSAEVSAPYILACNHIDANPKLIKLSLNGLQMLLNYEVVPPTEAPNILRVLNIQVACGNGEIQLKILQIVLQLANSLAQDSALAGQYLTQATIGSMLVISLQLIDSSTLNVPPAAGSTSARLGISTGSMVAGNTSVAVSSTAFATARQLVALVMDAACDVLDQGERQEGADKRSSSSQLPECALLILKELASFVAGDRMQLSSSSNSSDWLRGTQLAPAAALDLLLDVVSGWKHLFEKSEKFRAVLRDPLCKNLYPMIRSLSAECTRSLTYIPIMQKTLKLSRSLLLTFLHLPDTCAELEVLFQTLNHALIPDRTDNSVQNNPIESGFAAAAGIMARLAINKTTPSQSYGAATAASPRPISGAPSSLPLITLQTLHGPLHLPCSVAALIIEACFSFFLFDDVYSLMCKRPGGNAAIIGVLSSAILSCSNILCEGLANELNIREFESEMRSSQLVTLIEGVLTGTETDRNYVVRTLHDHFSTGNVMSITSADVLLLCFLLFQVLSRLLTRWVVFSSGNSDLSDQRGDRHFYAVTSGGLGTECQTPSENIRSFMQVCENSFDRIQETCLSLLSRSEDFGVLRRGIGVLSELTLCTGLLRLHRPCDTLLSTLSKLTVPHWHGQENDRVYSTSPIRWRHVQAFVRLSQVVHVLSDLVSDWDSIVDSFEQLVNLLGPNAASANGATMHEDLTQLDVDKIFQAVDRFISYTVFVSDDSLVRLMTSLVALSLNSLAVAATTPLSSNAPPSNPAVSPTRPSSNPKSFIQPVSGDGGKLRAASYMIEAINQRVVSYALHAAVEITKANAFRISCVWQMVTSHLRMVASHKVMIVRSVAVAATNDIVCCALECMLRGSTIASDILFVEHGVSEQLTLPAEAIVLTDDALYNGILPSFETVFAGRTYQRQLLETRLRPATTMLGPQLNQVDILSSLRTLSQIKYPDVRDQIMEGLLELLQGNTQEAVAGGWKVIIELLTSVPQSLVPPPGRLTTIAISAHAGDCENENEDDSVRDDDAGKQSEWQRSSLVIAFQCIKLIMDDFLETISREVMTDLVACLSAFSAQVCDVNISLTSVEMLWKVTDFVVAKSRAEGDINTTSAVLDVMMTRLLQLAMDSRPEVRNCATNTLFAAVVANSSMLTMAQWRSAFDDIIFPLFGRIESRSCVAMKNKEKARAPEIKKGVKMTVHHSRDTGHKQWSETRVLALRGLARVMRACTRLLMCENGFKAVWIKALEICVSGTQSSEADMEVTLAAVDTLFEMLKVSSRGTYKQKTRAAQGMRIIGGALVADDSPGDLMIGSSLTKSGAATRDECGDDESQDGGKGAAREELWQMAWTHVRLSLCFETTGNELPSHFCKHLKELYNGGREEEFKYSHFVQNLLELVPALARRRVRILEAISPFTGINYDNWVDVTDADGVEAASGSAARLTKHASSQLHREVMALLRIIRPSDSVAYAALLKTLCDIAYGTKYCLMEVVTSTSSKSVILAPIDVKLRLDCCDLLLSLLRRISGEEDIHTEEPESDGLFSPPTSAAWLAVTVDMISSRYWTNSYIAPIQRRICSLTSPSPSAELLLQSVVPNSAVLNNKNSVGWPTDVNIYMRQVAIVAPSSNDLSNNWCKSSIVVPELQIMLKLCKLPESFILADKPWTNIVNIVACALVPWNYLELQCQWRLSNKEQFDQMLRCVYGSDDTSPIMLYNPTVMCTEHVPDEDDGTIDAMINLLDELVKFANGVSGSPIARLIDALVGCARLCVSIVEFEGQMCLPKYHVQLLRHIITSLVSMATSAGTGALKTRALAGGMALIRDLLRVSCKPVLSHDQTYSMICAHALTSMLNAPSTLADIPVILSDDYPPFLSSEASKLTTPASLSMAYAKWFNIFQTARSEVTALSSLTSNKFAISSDRPHIFVLGDIARAWLESSCTELKQVALQVLRSIDTSSLLLQHVNIVQYVHKLEGDVSAMKSEVNVLKSAASLPF